MKYNGNNLKNIRFPLGGIGTGCISIAGNGALVDWEIFNRPNKGSINGYSHFAIKAEMPDGTIITGKTSSLLGASAAALLNALKKLGGINDEFLKL